MIRHFSSGGLVYRKHNGKIEFLLCKASSTSHLTPDYIWGLPKGWLDDAADGVPGPLTLGTKRATPEEISQAALREVREEAGVEAEIIRRIGETKYVFTGGGPEKIFKIVTYFLMEYRRDLPEGFGFETSEVMWADAVQAKDMLKKRRGECQLIDTAIAFLK